MGFNKSQKKWQFKSTKFNSLISVGEAPAYKNSSILTVFNCNQMETHQ